MSVARRLVIETVFAVAGVSPATRLNNVALDATEVGVGKAEGLAGSARLELVDGVVHLDPAPALFEAMLAGWVRQMRTRFLDEESSIKPRVALVRRLAEFSGEYPWEWGPEEGEEFIVSLRSPNRRRPVETRRLRTNSSP